MSDHDDDPDYLGIQQRRIIEALQQTDGDVVEAARLVWPHARDRHRLMDIELRKMESRRWVSHQQDGKWSVAPPGPWRLSRRQARLLRGKKRQ